LLFLGEDERLWRALVALWWGREGLVTSSRVGRQRLVVSRGRWKGLIPVWPTETIQNLLFLCKDQRLPSCEFFKLQLWFE